MRVLHGLDDRLPAAHSRVAIGVFDGVHLGHQRLLTEMVQAARAAPGTSVALTFDPHPAAALGRQVPLLLTTVQERIELLAGLGLDLLLVIPFTDKTARTPPSDFVDLLITHLDLAELWMSEGFAIGRGRTGDVAFLRTAGQERGFSTHVVEPFVWKGAPVSSSRVRRALLAGEIDEATGCLGRPYRLHGEVVHGDGRGRLFGLPTANLSLPQGRLIPADGIYACLVRTEQSKEHLAVVNVGTQPSFPGDQRLVEAHLLDFEGDLYGQSLAIDFHERLRDEMVFGNTEQLTAQIEQDICRARAILGSTRAK
jgi:riboflavin kinase/FMN adenylyltransferase